MRYLRAVGLAGFLLLLGVLFSVITLGLALPIVLPLMLLGFVLLFMGLEKRTDETQGQSKKARYDHWFSRINLVLGVWLIAAPFVLGYAIPGELSVETVYGSDVDLLVNPHWNDVAVGVLVSVFAAVRAFGISRALVWSWANTVLGAWLVAAPFVLGYAMEMQRAFLNDVLVGLLVVGWSLASAAVMRPSPVRG